MKKLIIALIVLIAVFALTACGGSKAGYDLTTLVNAAGEEISIGMTRKQVEQVSGEPILDLGGTDGTFMYSNDLLIEYENGKTTNFLCMNQDWMTEKV